MRGTSSADVYRWERRGRGDPSGSTAGCAVYGLSRYYVGDAIGKASATVILGYANLTEEAIREP